MVECLLKIEKTGVYTRLWIDLTVIFHSKMDISRVDKGDHVPVSKTVLFFAPIKTFKSSFLIVESNGRQAVSRKHERQPARQRSFDADVAIIGAGPVGLMLGALLARRNIRTVIYERRQTPYSAPRAIAFDPETLRTFQAIDRYEALEHSLLLDVPVAYFSGGGDLLARITNTDERLGFSPRGTFYQPELEAAISDAIPQWPALSLQRGVEVSDVCEDRKSVV